MLRFVVMSCSTKELNSLNARLNESLTAVYKLSNGVIQTLLNKIRPQATVLYTMVETIALLDMLLRSYCAV
jgi:DNA mismatch repair ATPase MutS